MLKRKTALAVLLAFLAICLFTGSITVSAAPAGKPAVLRQGMRGSSVTELQNKLKKLGYFSAKPTGYYGEITAAAVKKLQARYGLYKDGIVGKGTNALLDKLLGNSKTASFKTVALKASRGADTNRSYLMTWFDRVEDIFARGMTATVYDIETGVSFKAKRTYGYNHADCETLSVTDTNILKKIYGGVWSWDRRAVIVTIGNTRIAASMAGMPHAGVDRLPGGTYVSSRSAGYGSGINLDGVKKNGMNGHFDLHFLGSKTHGSDRVDERHQEMVRKAAKWAEENY